MKQYTIRNRNVPLSLRDTVITEATVIGSTIRLVFADGIRDLFKKEAVWTGRATVTISNVEWDSSSLTRFGETTYAMCPIEQLSQFIKSGRFEIVDELYGYRQLLLRCMWLTDTTCETVELSLSHASELVIRWEDEPVEEMYESESF
ncbi:hypothetical protein ACFQO8_02810 [Exiguobacterium aestuarii]|uniref:Uncharacterized protein n=1 Tax=Exiguobacterium aestuarii TaxID=273527 RepID=A0ABW2PHV2_9BACL|nr:MULTISPECIES: hypothetical protein [Exiguobacterium]MCT4786985.1 hypothetical protein [Exiguobacterium aestuarii]